VATALLCLGSAMVLAEMERWGVLRPDFDGFQSWETLTDVAIILLATAVAAHILLTDSARGNRRPARERATPRRRQPRPRGPQRRARALHLRRLPRSEEPPRHGPGVPRLRGARRAVGRLDRVESDLSRIRTATDRMAQLLEDLSSCRATGRIDRPHDDVPLEDVVREARALAEGRLSARACGFEVEGPLPVVRGDRRRLAELVQNRLDNAAKFRRAGRPACGSAPARQLRSGQATLFVRDNGIGIDPAHQDRGVRALPPASTRASRAPASARLARASWNPRRADLVESAGRARLRRLLQLAAGGPCRERGRADLIGSLLSARGRGRREPGRQPLLEAVEVLHSVAQASGRAAGSGTVIPSSVTRSPSSPSPRERVRSRGRTATVSKSVELLGGDEPGPSRTTPAEAPGAIGFDQGARERVLRVADRA